MTKKDYEKIAAAFVKMNLNDPARDSDMFVAGYCGGMSDALYTLSEVFRKDNPRFDQDRFLKACGL